jgi:hypothetical protein
MSILTALLEPPALSLLLAPAQRQSEELFRKIEELYHALGTPVPILRSNDRCIELQNGSRIVALPGKENTIRSFSSVKLLIIDEASRVPDEVYAAIRPMRLVSKGKLVALSTPWGKRGWWYQAVEAKDNSWHRVRITAHDCPRISVEELERERRELDEWFFKQEYLCEFLDAQDSAFRSEDIDAILDDSIEPLLV